MTRNGLQRLLVILLGVMALCVTILIVLSVINRNNQKPLPAVTDNTTDVARGGVEAVDINLPVPDYTLTDQTGQPFGSEQLSGKIYIVDFIFTRCPGPCPSMTMGMLQLQETLKEHPRWDDIRLVSISVDPDYDQPDVLADYAHMYGADGSHWKFLTGDRAEVWQLVTQGFRQQLSAESDRTDHAIAHTQKFVVVDRRGHIRAQFDGIDQTLPDGTIVPNEREELLKAVDRMLSDSP